MLSIQLTEYTLAKQTAVSKTCHTCQRKGRAVLLVPTLCFEAFYYLFFYHLTPVSFFIHLVSFCAFSFVSSPLFYSPSCPITMQKPRWTLFLAVLSRSSAFFNFVHDVSLLQKVIFSSDSVCLLTPDNHHPMYHNTY